MRNSQFAQSTRREFLSQSAGTGLLLGGGLGFLSRLSPVSAEEAELPPSLVHADSGVASTLRLLEQTPRERLLEEVAARVKAGLSYRELLAALMLAGVRNVQPRPSVGFKFHAVLVVNSAHLASLASPDTDRWLPIFWSLDRFKAAQVETSRANGWQLGGVDEAKVPPARQARKAFVRAMDRWDEEAADVAVAALARTAGRNECFELFARYGARDFRDIGHKAIYVANSFRTLEAVGWQHAEPVLRSLAYALLKREEQNPADADLAPDRPWRRNIELTEKVRPDWPEGRSDPAVADRLLETLRTASDADAAEAVSAAIADGASASLAWDAVLGGAAELLMRKRGIVALHAVTTANALRFAYEASGNDQTRLMMLLQAASFLTLFRDAAKIDPAAKNQFDTFEPEEKSSGDATTALTEVFATVSKDRDTAARKALAYLDHHDNPTALADTARRLVFLKGTDAHDYKYSSAVLEDYRHIAPRWRNRFLAASMFNLPGSGDKDNALIKRTRAAFDA